METDDSSDGWLTDSSDENAPQRVEGCGNRTRHNVNKEDASSDGEITCVPWTRKCTVETIAGGQDGVFVKKSETLDDEQFCGENSVAFDGSQSHEYGLTIIKKEEVDGEYVYEPLPSLAVNITDDILPNSISASITGNMAHSGGRSIPNPNIKIENSVFALDQEKIPLGSKNLIADFTKPVNEQLNQQKATFSSAITCSYDRTSNELKRNALNLQTRVAVASKTATANPKAFVQLASTKTTPPSTGKQDARKETTTVDTYLQSAPVKPIPPYTYKHAASEVTTVDSKRYFQSYPVKEIPPERKFGMEKNVLAIPDPVMSVDIRTGIIPVYDGDRCHTSIYPPLQMSSSYNVPSVSHPPNTVPSAVVPLQVSTPSRICTSKNACDDRMTLPEPSQSSNRTKESGVHLPSCKSQNKSQNMSTSLDQSKLKDECKDADDATVTSNANVPIIFQNNNSSVVCNIFVADDGKYYLVPKSQSKNEENTIKMRKVKKQVLPSGAHVKTETISRYEVSAPPHLINSIVKLNTSELRLPPPPTQNGLKGNLKHGSADGGSHPYIPLHSNVPCFLDTSGSPLVFRKITMSYKDVKASKFTKQIKFSQQDCKDSVPGVIQTNIGANGKGSDQVNRKNKASNQEVGKMTQSKAKYVTMVFNKVSKSTHSKTALNVSEEDLSKITRSEDTEATEGVQRPTSFSDSEVEEGKVSSSKKELQQFPPSENNPIGSTDGNRDKSAPGVINEASEPDGKRRNKRTRKRNSSSSVPPKTKIQVISRNHRDTVLMLDLTGQSKVDSSLTKKQEHTEEETVARKGSSCVKVQRLSQCENAKINIDVVPEHRYPEREHGYYDLKLPNDEAAISALHNAAKNVPKVAITMSRKAPAEFHRIGNNTYRSYASSVSKKRWTKITSEDDEHKLVATPLEDKTARVEIPVMPENEFLSRNDKMRILQRQIEEQEKTLEEFHKKLQEIKCRKSSKALSQHY